jgi:hypothetical protein
MTFQLARSIRTVMLMVPVCPEFGFWGVPHGFWDEPPGRGSQTDGTTVLVVLM